MEELKGKVQTGKGLLLISTDTAQLACIVLHLEVATHAKYTAIQLGLGSLRSTI